MLSISRIWELVDEVRYDPDGKMQAMSCSNILPEGSWKTLRAMHWKRALAKRNQGLLPAQNRDRYIRSSNNSQSGTDQSQPETSVEQSLYSA